MYCNRASLRRGLRQFNTVCGLSMQDTMPCTPTLATANVCVNLIAYSGGINVRANHAPLKITAVQGQFMPSLSCNSQVCIAVLFTHFTDHFGGLVEQSIDCVCLSVTAQAIVFAQRDL